MKKIQIISVIAALIFAFLLYYTMTMKWHPGPSAFIYYKDIEDARIPDKCVQFRDDACGLFACMVEPCWCDNTLHEGDAIINNEEDALAAVRDYLDSKLDENPMEKAFIPELDYAVKLNTVFYNVFAEDDRGNEVEFSVAVDGTVLRTGCGI